MVGHLPKRGLSSPWLRILWRQRVPQSQNGLIRPMYISHPQEAQSTVERVHGMYAMRCPLYRTLHKVIQLTSSFELVPAP